jgi:hypothetical protein
MQAFKIEMGGDGTLELQTTLSARQVAKFNGLFDQIMVVDNNAYLKLTELHGVLLTTSRQRAIDIVNRNMDIVKNYIIRDPMKFAEYGVASGIKPIGIQLLLDHLTDTVARRASDYRASQVLVSCIIAKHPGVMIADQRKAKGQAAELSAIVRTVKAAHSVCQVTGQPFTGNGEKHAHHIEGKSENPTIAADAMNLVVLKGSVHQDYHEWVHQNQVEISRATLGYYAKVKKGYSTPFVESLKSKAA